MDGSASQDVSNTMTHFKFNQMARSVSKDFVQLGYPTILTNRDGRDFVSLCSLMLNCSNLLSAFKAKASILASRSISTDSFTKLPEQPANSKVRKSGSSSVVSPWQTKKRGGIFSSSSRSVKQIQQQKLESLAKLTAEVARTMQFDEEFASIFEGIAETVRRDVEFVIKTTRCLPELEPAPAAAEGDQLQQQQQPPPPQPLSRDQQILTFFSTRWVLFRETLTQRLTEATRLAAEVESLRPFVGKVMRSKSMSGKIGETTDTTSEDHGEPTGLRRGHFRLSRQRSLWNVSVTKIPSLEAEIRRLKLEMHRREQRHKEELDKQAKERECLNREFRLAQRRNPALTRGPASYQPHHQQHPATQSHTGEESEKILSEVCQTLDALADSLADQACTGGRLMPPLAIKPAGDKKNSQQLLQTNQQCQQIQVYAENVCNAALTRINCLQSNCHSSRRRQAELEVLISILKARLDLRNDQLSDVAKFESVINDIARRLAGGASQQASQVKQLHQNPSRTTQAQGDDHKDSLVSRLTHRLRDCQWPLP